MSKNIITISREFESGLDKDFIEKKGEYSPLKNVFSYAFVGRDSTGASLDDYLYSVQRKIILEITEKEPCVIVGRCADFILRERADCLNVFIYGAEKEKSERIQKLYEKSDAEARKMMKDMDKKRSINYNYYTDQIWGAPHNYSLALNSSELGYECCAELIVQAAR